MSTIDEAIEWLKDKSDPFSEEDAVARALHRTLTTWLQDELQESGGPVFISAKQFDNILTNNVEDALANDTTDPPSDPEYGAGSAPTGDGLPHEAGEQRPFKVRLSATVFFEAEVMAGSTSEAADLAVMSAEANPSWDRPGLILTTDPAVNWRATDVGEVTNARTE